MLLRQLVLIAFLFLLAMVSSAKMVFALGDDTYGCCGDITNTILAREPAMVRARGLELFEKLRRETHSRLVVLEALDKSVCIELGEECGDLEPSIVQRLVKIARETLRQENENSWQARNYGISAFNAVLALAAFVVSIFAYRSSKA